MGAGRFLCVIIPFLLSLGSLVCILIVMTAGLTNKNIDMFTITPKNLSISLDGLQDISGEITKNLNLPSFGDAIDAFANTNVTAPMLGLQNGYQVYMWNYCYQNATNDETWCSKAAFNWAASALNTTELQGNFTAAALASTGEDFEIPKAITDALKIYVTIARWIQIVYIIALGLTALELIVGLFGFCSRIASCLTGFFSSLSTLAVIVASSGSTAASVIIVGAMKATLDNYGVKASVDTTFLAITWLAVALSIAAGLFWLFSSCCCGSERRNQQNGEKSYNPINIINNNGNNAPGAAPYPSAPASNGRSGVGYEPYRNV